MRLRSYPFNGRTALIAVGTAGIAAGAAGYVEGGLGFGIVCALLGAIVVGAILNVWNSVSDAGKIPDTPRVGGSPKGNGQRR